MRKQILIAALLVAPIFAKAQFFALTNEGFVNEFRPKNDFVKDKTFVPKAESYATALQYFHTIFVNPKNVISSIENESITVNFSEEYEVDNKCRVNMSYTFLYADSVLTIKAPYIVRITKPNYSTISVQHENGNNFSIFNKKGELNGAKAERIKRKIELQVNTFILSYTTWKR